MIDKIATALQGYKTYILSGAGIVIAVIGHFWGPVNIGSIQIPVFSWNDVSHIAWTSGLFSALHAKKGS